MSDILSDINDKVAKEFLMRYAYNMDYKSLFHTHKAYLKWKKKYQYSKTLTTNTKVHGDITLSIGLSNIEFHFVTLG